ncbi:MAG TPA: DEAD/DEAH box helicase [Planctomycetota bacterium]|nr:DEAD/DEAH box helicase [Planctomycetota bacterium]HRR81760.1 DEAD/DEAH box helicase [Planctomycetota bacterium]HRT94195.1 DEAD/DEAH box helicase [Planctomycetota bacterium]
MPPDTSNPLIVQGDRTVLLEVDNPRYAEARDALARFAELEKSPEHFHTYRISPLSLWNAAAAGMTAADVLEALGRFTKYDVPSNIQFEVRDFIGRYGRLRLERRGDDLVLASDDEPLLAEVQRHKLVRPYVVAPLDPRAVAVQADRRGHVKQALIRIGYPVEDLAGYVAGTPLALALRDTTLEGRPFALRPYQREAADVFFAGGSARGGSGVIVLPCGAGKTVVGMAAMARVQAHTLILCTNITAVRQWRRELLDKTTLADDQLGEYSGEAKEIRPVTLATYQILTYRRRKSDAFPHFGVFNALHWGLIVYDEVHLLPAPVFRVTAEIQACRRLGLTATLVREDHKEDDVFSLIGPKRCDVPWKVLEKQGWIATARCTEIRLPLPDELRMSYALSTNRDKFRIASENPAKHTLVRDLLARHAGDRVLIIGQFLAQLRAIARDVRAPLITGSTPNRERERLYADFRSGRLQTLIVSKVGNFAIDLPDANVAIQVSGTFGSRQEEAQRLGRILRPKSDGSMAQFYSLVTRDSRDADFAANRQLFLTEQGYSYRILDAHEVT